MSTANYELFPTNPASAIDAMLYQHTPAKARRSDPQTSHDAAATWTPEKATRVELCVYRFFLEFKSGTDGEMELWVTRHFPNERFGFSSLRKRRGDLVTKGVLRDSGRKDEQRHMIIWELAK